MLSPSKVITGWWQQGHVGQRPLGHTRPRSRHHIWAAFICREVRSCCSWTFLLAWLIKCFKWMERDLPWTSWWQLSPPNHRVLPVMPVGRGSGEMWVLVAAAWEWLAHKTCRFCSYVGCQRCLLLPLLNLHEHGCARDFVWRFQAPHISVQVPWELISVCCPLQGRVCMYFFEGATHLEKVENK